MEEFMTEGDENESPTRGLLEAIDKSPTLMVEN
jgi:hypothetical protein